MGRMYPVARTGFGNNISIDHTPLRIMTMLQTVCRMIVMWAIFDIGHARNGPPKILLQPQQSLYYSAVSNSSIMLTCGADGSTPIRLSWERNGVPVKFEKFENGGGVFDLNHAINNPAQTDEGEYICYVSNDLGHTMTYPIQLTQAVLDDHSKQNIVYDETAEQGSPFTLPCEIPYSVPEPEVYWVKITTTSSVTPQNRIQYDERITSDINGNLHALFIENSDTGRYRCVIYNSLLQKTTYGPIFNLQTTVGSQTTDPELIWNSDEFPVALHGSDVMIRCIVGGRPLPQVEWYDDTGAPMRLNQVTDYGRTLMLRNVRFTDARWYQCSVPGTTFTGGVNFQLTVEKSPSWIRKPNPIKANVGEQVSFNCSASGVPEPTITWYIDTTPVADVPANKKPSRIENTQLTGSTTSILHFMATSSFTVICEASNSHDYIWDGTFLYAEGKNFDSSI
ncbi:neural cell adhesion molecule L1-like [Mizuhopecten yessoensis]|uniref:neural cell adhesion molecule L1-like n=1 Tax=Mizuhopecten yessoensis TaxID=6573 RepID=UPI000B45BC92|nr:neural cell adhesion molecule L1-like [Mizuhopecten yessoensis]